MEYVILNYDGDPVTIEDGEIYYEDRPYRTKDEFSSPEFADYYDFETGEWCWYDEDDEDGEWYKLGDEWCWDSYERQSNFDQEAEIFYSDLL